MRLKPGVQSSGTCDLIQQPRKHGLGIFRQMWTDDQSQPMMQESLLVSGSSTAVEVDMSVLLQARLASDIEMPGLFWDNHNTLESLQHNDS